VTTILIAGIVYGALYAIVALGYTMVYGIIELINFAHGDVFIFGVFVSTAVMTRFINQNALYIDTWTSIYTIALAMLFSAVLCGILGMTIERVAYRPLRNAPRLAPLITAIGISLILENGMSLYWGGQNYTYPRVVSISTYSVLGTTITNIDVMVVLVALGLMVALDLFVNKSRSGKAMRAVAQDREAAAMMGINVNRIISLTFLIGSSLAGAGAVLYGMKINGMSYNSGFTLGLFAFTAAVLGGIGNIRGAVVGGLIIGIVYQYVSYLDGGVGTAWVETAVFSVLVLLLVFRPAGILGTNTAEKV
jgi:branched-chain amino acid transport system permease protein